MTHIMGTNTYGASPCYDRRLRWILFELTQKQIDSCVTLVGSKESGLQFITVDTQGLKAAEAG